MPLDTGATDGEADPHSAGSVKAQAGVRAQGLIEEIDVPIREPRLDQSGKRINDTAELVLYSSPFLAVHHPLPQQHVIDPSATARRP
jgi:hypothetical protein